MRESIIGNAPTEVKVLLARYPYLLTSVWHTDRDTFYTNVMYYGSVIYARENMKDNAGG